jgi:hypothetical protein
MMKKLAPFLASMIPSIAFAAPAGHDMCSGFLQGEKIQLVFGTGALCCDATVKIAKAGETTRKAYEFSADIDEVGIYSAKSDAGSIRYIVGHGNKIEVVLLSVHIGDVQIDNGFLTCKTLDSRPDPMAG